MKNIFALVLIIAANSLAAQVEFKTGNTEFDADLNQINASAKLDMPAFKADLTATFGVTPKNIEYMVSINMEPGEMYIALEISSAVNKPIESVIDTYEANRDKGWGFIAKEMGIKPGSPEFHALKGKTKDKKEKAAKSNGNSSPANVGNGNASRKKIK